MKVHVGTSGYGYKEWKGSFYPEKISAKEMLHFYAEHLTAVEINYTFYHMPTTKILTSWATQVPADFAFALKAPQVITHRKRLHNVEEECEYFFQTVSVLEKRMGPVLFQFPKSFRVDRVLLVDLLALLPADAQCAFEFRNSGWLVPEILELLAGQDCSLCMADSDENPLTEITGTATWGYLRLRRSDYTEDDLLLWREKILSQKWRKAYVFFKHEEEAGGAELAMRFRKLMGG